MWLWAKSQSSGFSKYVYIYTYMYAYWLIHWNDDPINVSFPMNCMTLWVFLMFSFGNTGKTIVEQRCSTQLRPHYPNNPSNLSDTSNPSTPAWPSGTIRHLPPQVLHRHPPQLHLPTSLAKSPCASHRKGHAGCQAWTRSSPVEYNMMMGCNNPGCTVKWLYHIMGYNYGILFLGEKYWNMLCVRQRSWS